MLAFYTQLAHFHSLTMNYHEKLDDTNIKSTAQH